MKLSFLSIYMVKLFIISSQKQIEDKCLKENSTKISRPFHEVSKVSQAINIFVF